jgi:HEAT repeat protein
MSRRPLPLTSDPRLRTLEGKLQLVAELRGGRTEKSAALLLELLCDQSWHVRERAVDALVERGLEVVGALMALLAEGLWYTRACAAAALGRIGAPEGLAVLAAHVEDDNPTVRAAVSGALRALVARHGARPVREALEQAGVDLDAAGLARLGAAERDLVRELEVALEREAALARDAVAGDLGGGEGGG